MVLYISRMKTKLSFWKLYIITAIVLIITFIIYFLTTDKTYGVNKTVGWAWDITNIQFWKGLIPPTVIILIIIMLITIIVRFILSVFKREQNN